MKKRKMLYISIFFFIFSILSIGISFASSNKVKIKNIVLSENSSNVEASVVNFDENNGNTNIIFHKVDDYAVFKLTIENNDNVDYTIESITDNNSDSNIKYEYSGYIGSLLKANGKMEISVKVKYNSAEKDIEKRIKEDKVVLTLKLIDKNGDGINPKTGDYIFSYLSLFIASLSGLLVLYSLLKRKTTKKVNLIIITILAIILIPISTNAAEEYYIQSSITLNNNISLMDKIKVIFISESKSEEKIVNYGESVDPVESPKKDGYEFTGWYQGNNKYDFSTKLTKDIMLTAKFRQNVFAINYNLNGGNAFNPNSYDITDAPILLSAPIKPGYNFTGWTDQDNNTSFIKFISGQSKELTFTANYEPIEHEITYQNLTDVEKSEINNPSSYTIEDEITLNNPENRNDNDGDLSLKFVGWKTDDNSISKSITIKNQNEDLNFEATWVHVNPEEYTITYNLNGGVLSDSNPNTYTKNTDTFKLNNPTKEGYDFIGWRADNTLEPIENYYIEQGTKGNIELEAVFILNQFSITYNLDGGELPAGITNPEVYTVDDTFTLNRPEKRGYNFIGWTGTGLDGLIMDPTIPISSTGNRNYTAHYEIINYDIDYVLDGGTLDPGLTNPTTYNVNDTITLNEPSKSGYVFNGWKLNNEGDPIKNISFSNEIGDKTYYADYTKLSYLIEFKKNDSAATGSMDNEVMDVGVAKALSKNLYVKEGYKFDGWYLNKEGTGTKYEDEEIVVDLALSGTVKLYAQWREATTAVFDTGKKVNIKMKQLSGIANPTQDTVNSSISKVLYSPTVPNEYRSDEYVVSDSSSQEYIYMWFYNGIIYYGSDADILYLNKDASYMFQYLRGVTEIENKFDTSLCLNMTQMYFSDHNLTTNDVSKFNTSNVNSMASMFGENKKMTSYNIKNWNVDSVKTFKYMFNQNEEVETLDLTGWTTQSAENMQNMFSSMYKLKTLKIGTFNTNKVTTMQKMFDNEREMVSLDLSNFNTENVKNMNKMFYNMYKVKNINLESFNTQKVTDMSQMFYNNPVLEELDLSSFNTIKVNKFDNMFSNCSTLHTIYVSDNFVTTALTSSVVMFNQMSNALQGEAGTTWSSSHTRSDYAKIDGGELDPGYFTKKNN